MKVLIPVDGSKYASRRLQQRYEGFLENKEIHLITVVEGTATGRVVI